MNSGVKLNKRNRFLSQILFYILRLFAVKNKKKSSIAGFSFDSIFLKINIDGTYEVDEIDFLQKFLQNTLSRKSCVLDIGANIGNHTIRLFSDMFLEVHCFEPNPKVNSLLNINVEHLDNVKTYNIGLSDKKGTATIKVDPLNLGAATIVNLDKNPKNNVEREFLSIELDTLDNIFFHKEIKIDLIKLDVEGHELNVLKGAKKVLDKYSPMIVFETNINKGNNKNNLIQYLWDNNYTLYVLNENFRLGSFKILKLLTMLFQDIFGKELNLVKQNKFEPGYYNIIIARKI